jgi:hypothetical protein
MRIGEIKFGGLVVAIACVAIVGTVRSDLMVTNNAGVLAGIPGIVHVPPTNGAPDSVNVLWSVVDPTGTNVTNFKIQQSSDLNTNWSDYTTSTQTVKGTRSGVIADVTTSTNQFYRMQLFNFR